MWGSISPLRAQIGLELPHRPLENSRSRIIERPTTRSPTSFSQAPSDLGICTRSMSSERPKKQVTHRLSSSGPNVAASPTSLKRSSRGAVTAHNSSPTHSLISLTANPAPAGKPFHISFATVSASCSYYPASPPECLVSSCRSKYSGCTPCPLNELSSRGLVCTQWNHPSPSVHREICLQLRGLACCSHPNQSERRSTRSFCSSFSR